jgi:hypothetical protein
VGSEEPLSRKLTIFVVSVVAVLLGLVAAYRLLPKRYSLGERLSQTTIFWNDKEAFIFLNTSTTGRVQNFVLDRLGKTRYGLWALFYGGGLQFMDTGISAYHVAPMGELKQLTLPLQPANNGDWSLQDGKLQLAPGTYEREHRVGFRWDGQKFVSLSPTPNAESKEDPTLSPDDEEDEGGRPGFLSPAARKSFKAAGWHYKVLSGYETGSSEAVLPFSIGKDALGIKITKALTPPADEGRFDFLAGGIERLEIVSRDQPSANQTVWLNRGWQEVPKQVFEEHVRRSGRQVNAPWTIWIWIPVFLFLMIWKFTSWGYVLMSIFGTKKRVLNNIPTAYAFPPAMPVQFPELDTEALERYSREFESLGFVRLLDFSLVGNNAKPVPSFHRVFANTRNHCFGEIGQAFPPRKGPTPLRCSIQSCLQDGWTLSFSDRKPQPANSLIRTKKAIGVSMPGTPTHELLQGFLQMREQVCQDLGISYLRDDSLEGYFAKVQRAATDIRDAVKQKNFATGIPEYYYRKLALAKSKSEYLWLGDYPKEAERRKQGVPVGANGS